MVVSTSLTPILRIVPWAMSFFTWPLLYKIDVNAPETFAVLGICPGLSVVFWLLSGRNLWKIEYDTNGIYAKKWNRSFFIPFEKVKAIRIGSFMDYRIVVQVLPMCGIDYINEKGEEDTIRFYGTSYDDVENSVYRKWHQKKIGIAQESLRRRKARR